MTDAVARGGKKDVCEVEHGRGWLVILLSEQLQGLFRRGVCLMRYQGRKGMAPCCGRVGEVRTDVEFEAHLRS